MYGQDHRRPPARQARKHLRAYLESRTGLLLIAGVLGLCTLLTSAQENRLRKNFEESQDSYQELATPLQPRTATSELSFQYFPPGRDANDTAPSLSNIQVLYLDTAKLMSNMAFMTQSLGVQCTYCHDLNDFSSDAKPTKQRAREMIRMVQNLNQNNPEGGINCHTCHQGKTLARPTVAADTIKQPQPGPDESVPAVAASQQADVQDTTRQTDSSDLPEQANRPEAGGTKDRPGDPVQQGMEGKDAADRLKARLADRLLARGADYVEQLGQKAFFGNHFQIESDLRLGRRGLHGEVDALIPFVINENQSTWFYSRDWPCGKTGTALTGRICPWGWVIVSKDDRHFGWRSRLYLT